MFSNKKTVKTTLRLEIAVDLAKLLEWAKDGYEVTRLVSEPGLDVGTTSPQIRKYQIDILPHPNGEDSIYYYVKIKSFANSLGGFENFASDSYDGSIINKYPNFGNTISRIYWEYRDGHLRVGLLTAEDKDHVILAAPTNEIYRLHQGDRLEGWGGKNNTEIISVQKWDEIIYAERTVGQEFVNYINALCYISCYKFGERSGVDYTEN